MSFMSVVAACRGRQITSLSPRLLSPSGAKLSHSIPRSKSFSTNMRPQSPQSDSVNAVSEDNRIHILGVGNLGNFYAHALAQTHDPPSITLLLHRPSLLTDWEQAGKTIEIATDGVAEQSDRFDVELVQPRSGAVIKNLIIATKTLKTVAAISSIKHRLTSASTILFTQNGMGTIEQVTATVFKDPTMRPKYLTCITSHGIFSTAPFRSVHAGKAHATIGPTSADDMAPRYLIDKIVAAKVLAATEVSFPEILHLQLEKLVINAMINPLTAIFRCQNGELFRRKPIADLMRRMLTEVSKVIVSLPELKDNSTSSGRFSVQNLEGLVLAVAAKTSKNTSSMLQDVQAGRETEIDYINGYIVNRGKETGIDCQTNEQIISMVKLGMRWNVEPNKLSGEDELILNNES